MYNKLFAVSRVLVVRKTTLGARLGQVRIWLGPRS